MSARSLLYTSMIAGILASASTAVAEPNDPANQVPDKAGRTGYVPTDPGGYATPAIGDTSKIIFLNRCVGGCALKNGDNDARINTSTIVSGDSILQEFAHGDAVWNDMVACVKELYAPFDVEIVTDDPGPNTFHHEAMVAGRADDIGYDNNALGVAPISSTCEPFNNVISFTFANAAGSNARFLCEIVGQESAHAFGLDHALDCTDPMTYLASCGPKYYRDATAKCGEFTERTCFCGGSAQNSHRKLLSVFGAGSAQIAGPTVNILLPSGDTVDNQFQVRSTATDARGIKRVEVWLNGSKYTEIDGNVYPSTSPYIYTAPVGLPDGVIDVEVRAFNDLEIMTSTVKRVTKGAPCTNATQCIAGQLCDADGRCFWEPPTGELGDDCSSDRECLSGLCPSSGGEQVCSELCVPGIADQCGESFDCLQIAVGQGVCWPAAGGGDGGCCSVGKDSAPGAELLLYGLAIMLLGFRRRR